MRISCCGDTSTRPMSSSQRISADMMMMVAIANSNYYSPIIFYHHYYFRDGAIQDNCFVKHHDGNDIS